MSDESKPGFRATIGEIVARKSARPVEPLKKERPWVMGFGPLLFKAGETRRIDAQPKCLFRPEKILTGHEDDTDAHLLGLYIDREEIMGLGGDSIALDTKKPIIVGAERWSDPAHPIEVEVTNRGALDRMIALSVVGTVRT